MTTNPSRESQLPPPLVSVAIITYNHRSYIAQALDSVLAQRRDFPIEIVISDDCSPDGTGAVIDAYQAKHPNLFRRMDPPQNVGMIANFDIVWRACTGRYIALLEGDDWWREDKLSDQVGFMERHPECTISGHTITYIQADGTVGEDHPVGWPETADIRLFINGSSFQTGSIMCRRGVVEGLPEWAKTFGLGDWPLSLLHAAEGSVGFVNRPLGFYRIHPGGVWSPVGPRRQLEKMLEAAQVMSAHFPKQFARLFEGTMGHLHFLLFQSFRDEGMYRDARRHLWQSCVHRVRGRVFRPDQLYKVPLRMLFPWIG